MQFILHNEDCHFLAGGACFAGAGISYSFTCPEDGDSSLM
jgi:hypothetical protein